ncbi:MAG: sel1 repeat family protein [Lachnospiraceae bacterium]
MELDEDKKISLLEVELTPITELKDPVPAAEPAVRQEPEIFKPEADALKHAAELAKEELYEKGLAFFRAENYGEVQSLPRDYQAPDYIEALRMVKKATRNGNTKAQYNCGSMYLKGKGTPADRKEALEWYLKAAGQEGEARADTEETSEWYKNTTERKADKEEADSGHTHGIDEQKAKWIAWNEKAARQGDAKAQFICGNIYYKGDGVKENIQKALSWYKKAARQGNVNAQFLCGNLFRKGRGTKKDKEQALSWYEKAAEQGNVSAQFICGLMYEERERENEDKKKDMEQAVKWYIKAASQTEDKEIQKHAKEMLAYW